ncbi:MAG: class I SAM-dependent methyltransferase [Chloroflexi bacterium]|nr:MAG: class I SAM-dependent methyltransferase [Chloroflexota bacterium]
MRLTEPEFKAMNTALRRFVQRTIEFPIFRSLGLKTNPGHMLEIGCGSGFGATLLLSLKPASYIGIDLMPEQIALAQKHQFPNADFRLQDATNLSCFEDGSKDTIVIFGALHHIPAWQLVVRESYRVLCPGGMLFIEEPGAEILISFERIFHWGHPDTNLFTLKTFEAYLESCGFSITSKRYFVGFGSYAAQKLIQAES